MGERAANHNVMPAKAGIRASKPYQAMLFQSPAAFTESNGAH